MLTPGLRYGCADRWSRKYHWWVSAVALTRVGFSNVPAHLQRFWLVIQFYGIYIDGERDVSGDYLRYASRAQQRSCIARYLAEPMALFLVERGRCGRAISRVDLSLRIVDENHRVTFFVTVISCLLKHNRDVELTWFLGITKMKIGQFLFQSPEARQKRCDTTIARGACEYGGDVDGHIGAFLDMGQSHMSGYIGGVGRLVSCGRLYAFALALVVYRSFYPSCMVAVALANLPVSRNDDI